MKRLDDDQVRQFHEQGYLKVRSVLQPADLAPVIAEFEEVIDRTAAVLKQRGEITELGQGEAFDTRLTGLTRQSLKAYQALFQGKHRGPELFALLRHDKLLDLIEPLVGPEIMCHPAYRVRAKLPDLDETKRMTVVAWHQDTAYLEPECDRHLIVTVWIALTESTVENGCLEVLPFVHKRGIRTHVNVRGQMYLDIPEYAQGGVETVPLTAEPGDVILMTNLTPHCSGSNRTDKIRWSLDFRYHNVDTPSGYPAEAGFLARSRRHPETEVQSFEDFEHVRTSHQPRRAARWRRWRLVEALP